MLIFTNNVIIQTQNIDGGIIMYELRELTLDDTADVYEMVQEINTGENGFVNSLYSNDLETFQGKLQRNVNMSKGVNLEPQYVPQTIYWLYVNGKPVGYGKLRHYLNDHLLNHGGHIGYVIRPSERGKGYAKMLLEKLLEKAKSMGIDKVLLTCDETNIPSRKVIESNDGMLEETKDDSCFYWIYL
jgi:predicted acetyltransferase